MSVQPRTAPDDTGKANCPQGLPRRLFYAAALVLPVRPLYN
jgi:hypothetical protein